MICNCIRCVPSEQEKLRQEITRLKEENERLKAFLHTVESWEHHEDAMSLFQAREKLKSAEFVMADFKAKLTAAKKALNEMGTGAPDCYHSHEQCDCDERWYRACAIRTLKELES